MIWPFDLRGPDFLLLYLLYGLIVLAVVYWARRASEPISSVRLTDPYQIAYLRGGAAEAIRVAIAALVDRGLLLADGEQLVSGGVAGKGWHPLDRALILHFANVKLARSAITDRTVVAAASVMEPELARLELLPGPQTKTGRRVLVLAAWAALWWLAGTKIAIGMARNRPVAFLVLLASAFSIVALLMTARRRTRSGEAALADLRTLFSGLARRTAVPAAAFAGGELALATAVFGMAALPSERYRHIHLLFPGPSASSSSCGSGSSCSSGSSCGGGCGGGGCGGCGS